ITASECRARVIGGTHCCFSTQANPQCFYSNSSTCQIQPTDRFDLLNELDGDVIDRTTCESELGCFDALRAPRCYYASSSSCYFFPPEERVDCGWHGITRASCRLKGCCLETTRVGRFPQCFN